MVEQNRLRQLIRLRYSPLLDMALSLLVLQNPERFGNTRPWEGRVLGRLPEGLLDQLREVGRQVDLFGLVLDLEVSPTEPVPDALRRLQATSPAEGTLLLKYWEAISPEVAAQAGVLAVSIQTELDRLSQMDPAAFLCKFSDRVTMTPDREAIHLQWGGGMTVPLAELEQILFVPSVFCPRRLMFYRLETVQIFFYDPVHEEPAEAEEAPESLVLGFSALADTTRLRLLRLVARETMPAQEMAKRLGVNDSTVSRHLRVLMEAGLVGRDHQEGKFLFYSLQPDRIDQLASAVKAYLRREKS